MHDCPNTGGRAVALPADRTIEMNRVRERHGAIVGWTIIYTHAGAGAGAGAGVLKTGVAAVGYQSFSLLPLTRTTRSSPTWNHGRSGCIAARAASREILIMSSLG